MTAPSHPCTGRPPLSDRSQSTRCSSLCRISATTHTVLELVTSLQLLLTSCLSPYCLQQLLITVRCIKKVKVAHTPYSIAERRVPELILVLGSQPRGDVSHKPGGRMPLLSARPAVIPATHKRAATNFAAW